MADFNLTPSDPSIFTLVGIPGLEDAHIWISIPFCTCYVIGLFANFTILFIVGTEKVLHKPMYLLICMLALTDVSMSTCVMPKTLSIFWFKWKGITLDGCLAQMFFFQAISIVHSGILVTMAFDRYVAICNPLRYSTILTNARTVKLGLVGVIRAILFFLPLPLIVRRLPFCANRVIQHTFCDHMAVAKLSCGDITVNRIYGMVLALVIVSVDLMLIALSYILIIRALLRISSKKAHQKALSTCTAHILVILMSYPPGLFASLSYRFGQGVAPYVHMIFSNIYFVTPPMFNPIVYGVNTKELREKVGKYLCRM
ncbi:olfactory receptor 52P1-like [Carettochelys insculpta]|uniref:olfactory receptor 52P1-like n=1 Tax=Carettochelys insculpta TaxID=44489 RepID=UPI003EBB0FCB